MLSFLHGRNDHRKGMQGVQPQMATAPRGASEHMPQMQASHVGQKEGRMMTEKQNFNTITEAAAEISRNTSLLRSFPEDRKRILMELRHDLDDAMKAVKRLESANA